jgi:hypothetical protein
MRPRALAIAGIFAVCLLAGAPAAAQQAQSVGPGVGILMTDGTRDLPCGFGHLTINSDQEYSNAYAWSYCVNQPPDWGAFAECFTATADLELCGLVFDLTTVDWQQYYHFLLDAYVWDDFENTPGNVLAVVTGYDPYPIAVWPEISRRAVPLTLPITGRFWIGEWGNWDNVPEYGWFVAADDDGPGAGCPMTKVYPCLGLPSGWQPVEITFPETHAMGIGYYGHAAPTVATPEPKAAGRIASWGRVKSLYR